MAPQPASSLTSTCDSYPADAAPRRHLAALFFFFFAAAGRPGPASQQDCRRRFLFTLLHFVPPRPCLTCKTCVPDAGTASRSCAL
ncbi:hypothetical protein GQ53DRAFT_752194 [Thozetella sp. PMI_491]|nr:hypothetical protein GQ53DRAFT_752194 [Thozetella sp. PMI_491]